MGINVYINFDGNCREALEFYKKAFNTDEPRIMTFKDAPPNPESPIPEEAKNRIMHAELNILGSRVMFSDIFPGMPFVSGNNITLTLMSKDIDELKNIYNKLKEDATINMELQETFWSKCFGSLTDKFGISWQLSHEA